MDLNGLTWLGHAVPKEQAPFFRREFLLDSVAGARLAVCGLGWHEVWLNGRKVGDQVLDPVFTAYDRRYRYRVHEVSDHLRPGLNTLGVILGNGWYAGPDRDVWDFHVAAWRDRPKFALRLLVDGAERLASAPEGWKATDAGPIVFNSLRSGEVYDARRALPGWSENGFDDAAWTPAVAVAPPGGVGEEQAFPPCRVTERIAPVRAERLAPGRIVYDFGVNLSGWCRLRVRGPAGARAEMRYGERLGADGSVDKEHIGKFLLSGENQRDVYLLGGAPGVEEWAPRFTFHGFQYCQLDHDPSVEVEEVTAEFVHTDFPDHGDFATDHADLEALRRATRAGYRGNFVGFPSDCPHREKLGWTGDAHLAAETGLCHFGVAPALEAWLDTLVDAQRPSGQLPGIAPTAGWGFNWGSGPAWDAALFIVPELVYLYTGRDAAFVRHWDAMRRYLEYADHRAGADGLVGFGLGDWNHVVPEKRAPAVLVDSAYLLHCHGLAARFARRLGRAADAVFHDARADALRHALNARFLRPGGHYADDEPTALALALLFGIAPAATVPALARRLDGVVRANRCRAEFGIFGARAVPRALAETGYLETAFRVITQPSPPGWVHWLRQGATTLWGNWDGGSSRNHIMFGDVNAWCVRYLGGLAPDEAHPGFGRVTLRPRAVPGVTRFHLRHRTPRGWIDVRWQVRKDGALEVEASAPPGVPCEVLPSDSPRALPPPCASPTAEAFV